MNLFIIQKVKIILGILLVSSFIFSGLLTTQLAYAGTGIQELKKELNQAAKETGFKEEKIGPKKTAERIGNFINVILGFIGAITTLIIIYGGFLWITAAGNQEQLTKAKKYVINAAIGIIIIGLAYIIVSLATYVSINYLIP